MENCMEVSQKTENRTTMWSSNYTVGVYMKQNKNTNTKRYKHLSIHNNIIHSCQDVEATKMLINR